MSKFKSSQKFDIKDEKSEEASSEVRVLKMEGETSNKATDFKFQTIDKGGIRTYGDAKKKFGSFAVTDPEARHKDQKASKFHVSEMLRGYLHIDDEERDAIDEKVNARVDEIREKVKKEAFEKGYEEGTEKARQEVFEQFRQEGESRLKALDELLKSFEAASEDIFKENERFLVSLIYQISKMIILREIKEDKEYLARLVKELIERLGTRENITIFVSEDSMDDLQKIRASILKEIGDLKNLSVEASQNVQTAGCRVESQWNSIDATIETQLAKVAQALSIDVSKGTRGTQGVEEEGARVESVSEVTAEAEPAPASAQPESASEASSQQETAPEAEEAPNTEDKENKEEAS